MALLLLFEKSDSLNFKELHATTKMSEEQFPRYVQSLVDAKLLTSNTEVLYIIIYFLLNCDLVHFKLFPLIVITL